MRYTALYECVHTAAAVAAVAATQQMTISFIYPFVHSQIKTYVCFTTVQHERENERVLCVRVWVSKSANRARNIVYTQVVHIFWNRLLIDFEHFFSLFPNACIV